MQEWILAQSGLVVYISLFFLLIGGAIGLPIPEDLPLILAGILAQSGKGDLNILFLICYASILLGDLVIYGIGRRFGPALFNKPWFKARVSRGRLLRIKKKIERRSLLMIFLARHLFYLRTVTFLICGAVRVNFKKFLIADALAALISVPLMMWLGFTGAEHFEDIKTSIRKVEYAALYAGLALIIVIAGIYLKRKYFPSPPEEEDTLEDLESEIKYGKDDAAPPAAG